MRMCENVHSLHTDHISQSRARTVYQNTLKQRFSRGNRFQTWNPSWRPAERGEIGSYIYMAIELRSGRAGISNPPPPTQTLWKSRHLAAIGSCPLQFLKSSSIRAQFTLRRQTSDQRRPCKPHSNKGPPPTRAGRKKLKDDTKLLWNISLTLRIRGSNRGKFAALTSIY